MAVATFMQKWWGWGENFVGAIVQSPSYAVFSITSVNSWIVLEEGPQGIKAIFQTLIWGPNRMACLARCRKARDGFIDICLVSFYTAAYKKIMMIFWAVFGCIAFLFNEKLPLQYAKQNAIQAVTNLALGALALIALFAPKRAIILFYRGDKWIRQIDPESSAWNKKLDAAWSRMLKAS